MIFSDDTAARVALRLAIFSDRNCGCLAPGPPGEFISGRSMVAVKRTKLFSFALVVEFRNENCRLQNDLTVHVRNRPLISAGASELIR